MSGVELIQGSEAWKLARLGKVTASRIGDLMARTRSGYGASRANYQAELLIERITGQPSEHYVSQAMMDGTEREPDARNLYAFLTGTKVVEVGFVEHPKIPMAGCSPDGYVADLGLVEFKSPIPATHLNTLLTETVDDRYVKQALFQLACTGRAWCDFVSYSPSFPEPMRLYTQRIHRDDKRISELEKEVETFLSELDGKLRELNKRYAPPVNILSAG